MLCERCQRFDIQAFGRDPHPYRGVPLLSVIQTASRCSFCSLLLESLQKECTHFPIKEAISVYQAFQQLSTRKWLSRETLQLMRFCCSLPLLLLFSNWIDFAATKATRKSGVGSDSLNIASIDAFVGILDEKDPRAFGFARFHVAADPGEISLLSSIPDSYARIQITPLLTRHPSFSLARYYWSSSRERPWSSEKSIESIQIWHRKCVSNHPRCRKTYSGTQSCQIESTRLPTRCIETLLIATQDGARSWRHILRETAGERGQYISLSHRWDEETKTSQTTAANYMCRLGKCFQETHHTQPCTSDTTWIPRLFAETRVLAHDLGIKYVWIDSICIKQGDDEDWNQEAPHMAQYYQHAWLTVVAANNGADDRLLDLRRTKPVPRMTRLPYMNRNGEQKGYFYLQHARPDVLGKNFSDDVEKSGLLQRGWVFQKWRLSRRIIAFSSSDFFMHCHTSGTMSPLGDCLMPSEPYHGTIVSAQLNWTDLVSEYSGLRLTYLAKDRLMALGGVASEVGRAMKGITDISGNILSDDVLARRYVCGLWLVHIHYGLLWEQALQGSRERLSGIPTWSWASMASHITDQNNERILTGMSVRWPKDIFVYSPRERLCAISSATTIPVDNQNWLPQFSNRPVPDDVPSYEYGNENRFIILTIHSSLPPVQIGNLLSEDDADLANEATSRPDDYDRRYKMSTDLDAKMIAPDRFWRTGLWRGVCFSTNPYRITGWASVEHPELQSDEEITSCSGSIFALFLERYEEKGGLFCWAKSLSSRVIFSVLLVRRVNTPGFNECFERVGVGRLFGEEARRMYLSTEKTTISLV